MAVTGSPPRAELPPEAYARMTLVLRLGLYLAVVVLLGSLTAYLIVHPGADSAGAIAQNPILGYLGLAGLIGGLRTGSAAAYLTLGLLVLVATPVVRVLSGLYYFHRNGERTMAAVTFTVFVMLLVGLFAVGPWVH